MISMRLLSPTALTLFTTVLLLGCAEAKPPCDNTCAEPGVEQICVSGGIATCTEYPDGCLHFAQPRLCAEGKTCEVDGTAAYCDAACATPCAPGESFCDGGLLRACTVGDDGCPSFDEGTACAAGQRCDGAGCVDETTPCEDDCAVSGQDSCDGGGVRQCGPLDQDSCLDLGAAVLCQTDEQCVDGACVRTCSALCPQAGARSCDSVNSDLLRVCILVDGCLEWGDATACPDGQRCDTGACVQTTSPCTDDCATPGMSCDSNSVVECADFDADDCLDLRTPVPCAAGTQICQGGACVPRPAPQVIISEVLYDSAAADDGIDTMVFVELFGPAGTSLEDVKLIGVNGANGNDYNSIPLSGTLPADGYFVITHSKALPALAALSDLINDNVNFQNGSSATDPGADAIQLRFLDEVIDAVGYGLGANLHGEGLAAPPTPENLSISRDSNNTDTNDNAADFSVGVATPGAAAQ